MKRRVVMGGKVRNKAQQRGAAARPEASAVIVQVQLVGEEKERFLAFKSRADFSPSNAEVGKKLMFVGLDTIEAQATAPSPA